MVCDERDILMRRFPRLILHILLNLRYLPQSRIRICRCCHKQSLIVSLSKGDEFKVCIRCRANLRYEMMAEYLRTLNLKDLDILELDPSSPLRPLLGKAKNYVRTYFSSLSQPGTIRSDGTRCEDITSLTFDDCSFDIIISSDVLEHVPNMSAAFTETKRVLRPGGFHLFTAPVSPKTLKRAEIIDGKIIHLMEPEYHNDPLTQDGILAFWNFGMDAAEFFSQYGLEITIVDGPKGRDNRTLWKATKKA